MSFDKLTVLPPYLLRYRTFLSLQKVPLHPSPFNPWPKVNHCLVPAHVPLINLPRPCVQSIPCHPPQTMLILALCAFLLLLSDGPVVIPFSFRTPLPGRLPDFLFHSWIRYSSTKFCVLLMGSRWYIHSVYNIILFKYSSPAWSCELLKTGTGSYSALAQCVACNSLLFK